MLALNNIRCYFLLKIFEKRQTSEQLIIDI